MRRRVGQLLVAVAVAGMVAACGEKSAQKSATNGNKTGAMGAKRTPPPKKLGPFERHKVLKGHELAITALAFRPVSKGSFDKGQSFCHEALYVQTLIFRHQ